MGNTHVECQIVFQDTRLVPGQYVYNCTNTGISIESQSYPEYYPKSYNLGKKEVLCIQGSDEEQNSRTFHIPKSSINKVLLAVHNLNKALERRNE